MTFLQNISYTFISFFIFGSVIVFATPTEASVLDTLAADLEAGEWVQMPTNPTLDSNGLQDSHFYFANSGAWDSDNDRMLWAGGPGGCCATDPQHQMLNYDEHTDSWSVVESPYFTIGHGYDLSTYGNGLFYYTTSLKEEIRTWDGTMWSDLPELLPFDNGTASAMSYFPEIETLVFVNNNGKLATYTDDAWTTISGGSWGGYHMFAEHNPVHGVVWLGAGNGSNRTHFRLNQDLTLTPLSQAPFSLSVPNAIQVVDPISGDYLVLNRSNNSWWAYDIMNDTWSQVDGMTNKPGINETVFAVTLPEHGLIMLVNGKNKTAHLYRHSESPAPPLEIALNTEEIIVEQGADVTLSWSVLGSDDSTSCVAFGGWDGQRSAIGGVEVIENIATTTEFGITCMNADGTTSTSIITIEVLPPAGPNPFAQELLPLPGTGIAVPKYDQGDEIPPAIFRESLNAIATEQR